MSNINSIAKASRDLFWLGLFLFTIPCACQVHREDDSTLDLMVLLGLPAISEPSREGDRGRPAEPADDSPEQTQPSPTCGIGTPHAGLIQEAYIKPSNVESGDKFGRVAISGDTLVVGVPLEDSAQTTISHGAFAAVDNLSQDSGAVYVYRREGANWKQEAYIKATNAENGDSFGYSVSISGDIIVVGAPEEDSDATTITNGSSASLNNGLTESGAVYVYQRTGSTWAQVAYIKAVNNTLQTRFGESVAIASSTIVVGAPLENSSQTSITNGPSAPADWGADWSGAVYVYERNGSQWEQQAYLKPSNGGAADQFGQAVAISNDSNTIVVGSPGEDSEQASVSSGSLSGSDNNLTDSGAAYAFRRTGFTWAQEGYLKASNPGANDRFGANLSISGDVIVVGVPNESSSQQTVSAQGNADDSSTRQGAAYVFRRNGSVWMTEAFIKAGNGRPFDEFGESVSIVGDMLIVGAPGEESRYAGIINGSGFGPVDTSGGDLGAAYLYRWTGTSWVQAAYIKPPNPFKAQLFGSSVSISNEIIAVGAPGERSRQQVITNGIDASCNVAFENAGAVYVQAAKP